MIESIFRPGRKEERIIENSGSLARRTKDGDANNRRVISAAKLDTIVTHARRV